MAEVLDQKLVSGKKRADALETDRTRRKTENSDAVPNTWTTIRVGSKFDADSRPDRTDLDDQRGRVAKLAFLVTSRAFAIHRFQRAVLFSKPLTQVIGFS